MKEYKDWEKEIFEFCEQHKELSGADINSKYYESKGFGKHTDTKQFMDDIVRDRYPVYSITENAIKKWKRNQS
jgi:hypothetical protein